MTINLRYSLEVFHTLVHGLEGVVDTVSEQFRVHVDERVVHPGLVPLLPVSSRDPQVLVGLKLSSQLAHLVILLYGENCGC